MSTWSFHLLHLSGCKNRSKIHHKCWKSGWQVLLASSYRRKHVCDFNSKLVIVNIFVPAWARTLRNMVLVLIMRISLSLIRFWLNYYYVRLVIGFSIMVVIRISNLSWFLWLCFINSQWLFSVEQNEEFIQDVVTKFQLEHLPVMWSVYLELIIQVELAEGKNQSSKYWSANRWMWNDRRERCTLKCQVPDNVTNYDDVISLKN